MLWSSGVLFERHDKWQGADRRYLSEASVQVLFSTPPILLPVPARSEERPAGSPAPLSRVTTSPTTSGLITHGT